MAAKDLFLEELDKEAWNCIVGNLAKVVEEGELCRLSADALATFSDDALRFHQTGRQPTTAQLCISVTANIF